MLGRWFRAQVLAHPGRCFLAMCLAFAGFGVGTYNLFNLVRLNLELIAEHGTMALRDGALAQALELLFTLLASMAAYVVFKACEHELVHRLTHPD